MSVFDRIVGGLKGQIELRGDIDRLALSVGEVRILLKEQDERLRDQDRRLVRIETLVEVAQAGGLNPRQLRDR